jgi:hypothetical protein
MIKDLHELLRIVCPIFSMPSYSTIWDAYAVGYHEGVKDCQKIIKDLIDKIQQDNVTGEVKVVFEKESDTITKEEEDE